MNQERTITIKTIKASIPANEQCEYCENPATGYARQRHRDIPHCDEHEREPWIVRVKDVTAEEFEEA
jgi:hypothetical protein